MAETIIEQVEHCLDKKVNFLLSGGAGSGKTYTLIQTLNHIFQSNNKARVACITYTNVAANEIKERSPYSKLRVSTIHDFLWDETKDYQKNLKQSVVALINAEIEIKGSGISYSGDNELTVGSLKQIEYQNYRNLEKGIISHDDVLKIASHMYNTYPLLSKILCDKYDYIFVDEYQDTNPMVISIFLDYIKMYANGKLCVGFFGDKMQSIYETGVGNIQKYVDSGYVHEIIKEDNYRCSQNVIKVLNNIRNDFNQNPAKRKADGTLENKQGSAKFICSSREFDLQDFRTSQYVEDWNFEDSSDTKILFLTHKLSAIRLGFAELLASYKYSDNLIGNEPDYFASQLLKIGGILYYYNRNNFAYVISEIQCKIRTNADKKRVSNNLTTLCNNLSTSTIEDVINGFDTNKLIRKDDRFTNYVEKNSEEYEKIKILPASQILAYFQYYNDFSPYSTQHGIKGAEFENVLVIMDNGRWNNYNFKYYFEKTSGKEKIIERTERIFYVSCSRAMNNLVVYYPDATPTIIQQAKKLFGDENVYSY